MTAVMWEEAVLYVGSPKRTSCSSQCCSELSKAAIKLEAPLVPMEGEHIQPCIFSLGFARGRHQTSVHGHHPASPVATLLSAFGTQSACWCGYATMSQNSDPATHSQPPNNIQRTGRVRSSISRMLPSGCCCLRSEQFAAWEHSSWIWCLTCPFHLTLTGESWL